ncbi:VOC family protein [Ornithinibacillus sp. L9]|uniref:VOC family protein n=1 Tax=Ornithinibacillus caprae TaxID=2678566 RepID=A0A6N8FPG0_9BACI|nr:VOC family protein [Ornithinibacillus caprae]MUK89368.1 VOC family protein [Ornithinibacillus caprae]
MSSPIKNKINTVFVPVRDIKKASDWYSTILGVSGEVMHDHLFVASMKGTGLVLDEMPAWRKKGEDITPFQAPAVQFVTDDIEASYRFMEANGVELVTDIQHGHFFVFKDLDGNMLMVMQDQ